MSFVNDADFQDDFRKVGEDVTAGFEAPGKPNDPTELAGSENLGVVAKADEEDEDADDEDDLEEDDDLDEADEDDPDDEDLDDDDEDEDDDLDEDDDDLEDEDDEDEEDDDEEPEPEDDDAVKARLGTAEARVRAI